MKVITHPNPQLREMSEAVKKEDLKSSEILKLIEEMGPIMFEKDGVGLAAPQVGVSKRVIVININDRAVPFINPKIIKKSILKDIKEEGCLSVPGVFGRVKRHSSIKVKFMDIEGNEHEIKARGYLARIFQHEIDHLDGLLFLDRLVSRRYDLFERNQSQS